MKRNEFINERKIEKLEEVFKNRKLCVSGNSNQNSVYFFISKTLLHKSHYSLNNFEFHLAVALEIYKCGCSSKTTTIATKKKSIKKNSNKKLLYEMKCE